ncbi:MAG: hypothetical protein ACLFS6_08640 [Methanomassiliicoccales archaeon]
MSDRVGRPGSECGVEIRGEGNRAERLRFIHEHAEWLRSVPNEVWSKHQAELIDGFMESAENFSMSALEYLRMKGELRETRESERNREEWGLKAGHGPQIPNLVTSW